MSTSPVPNKTPAKIKEAKEEISPTGRSAMSFPDALRDVIDGGRITKLEWGDPRIYLELKGEYLMIHKADGTEHSVILRDGDLLGTDWQVLDYGPSLMD